ncbi:MAG: hypothetical protein FJZ47_00920 [Candidatus Tectomicrobia bacterium]|uniref:Uncharacterized protein n=1 Tax=Tectimicrobiota bacterium TaxID=2528274 RepID=A0A937VZ67_UNCTE|nr:hypothetical protein [Candidatus Tectomicrobia bacterium]
MNMVQVCSQCQREVEAACPAHPGAYVEHIHIEQVAHFQSCSHCGQALSAVNIRLALEDIGGGVALNKLTLCCPGHSEVLGCQSYQDDDHGRRAYWYLL